MANFLDLISSEAPIVSFIRGLINTPASARAILSQARSAGHSIGNATGLQVINYLRSEVQSPLSYVQNLANDKLPNLNNIGKSLTKQLRNFAYVVELNGVDALTGEGTTRHVTVSTNKLLTKQEAIDFAVNIVEDQPQGYNIVEFDSDVVNINQNAAGLIQPFNSSDDSGIPF